MERKAGDDHDHLQAHHRGGDRGVIWKHIVAGAGAGWATALITCPLDVVKVRLQSTAVSPSVTPIKVMLRDLWRVEGIQGLYRGLSPTMIGYLPSFSIYFPLYHVIKTSIASWRGSKASEDPIAHMGAAMLAGAAGNVLTNPIWLIRTRLMTQHMPSTVGMDQTNKPNPPLYKGLVDAVKAIKRAEGTRGFFKGAAASLLGVTHVAVQFPLYERLKRVASKDGDPRNISSWQVALSSAGSKVVASTATYPHEIIRTRLQIQREGVPRYSGISNAIRTIALEEGIAGFYRGLRANILRVIPASCVTFVTYETLLRHLE